MKLVADTHTHTLASAHAYSTILENVRAAADAGLKWLGWTDHGPAIPDAPHIWHFQNFSVVPDQLLGVRVLKGAEANILDDDGQLDMPDQLLARLEWVIASIHGPCMNAVDVDYHTRAYIGAAKNPYVDVIGHSGQETYRYDYEVAVKVFREYGKLVELNQGSFLSRPDSIKNCAEIAKLCKKYECRVVLDSDAHFATAVGRVPDVMQMLAEIDFPEHLIVNGSSETFAAYLEERALRIATAEK